MRTRFLWIVSLLVVGHVVAACGGQASAADPATGDENSQVVDLAGLTEALGAAGASVESGGTIEQAFFTVPGQVLKVNGVDLQVFEYDSAEAMGTEASQISEDGSTIGTSMVSWIESPHFYRAGRMIVLYVGEEQAIRDLLEEVLGPQFAGR